MFQVEELALIRTRPSSVYSNLNALTISAWVLCPRSASFTGWRPIAVKDASGVYRPFFALFNATVVGGARDLPSGFSQSVEIVPADKWTHVAMTWNSASDDKVHLFFNGAEATYQSQPSGSGTPVDDSHDGWWIGRDQSSTNMFDGDIENVSIWDRVLTSEDIAALAAGRESSPLSTTGLVGFWKGGRFSSYVG